MSKKTNKEPFIGYPHYPTREDITYSGNNNGMVGIDVEPAPPPFNTAGDDEDSEVAIVQGTEADITEEDLRTLETSEQNMDTADGRNLVHSSLDSTDDDGDLLNEDSILMDGVTGQGLDVPGASDDDANEEIGEEDEENNYYSLGGDNHESQEESKE